LGVGDPRFRGDDNNMKNLIPEDLKINCYSATGQMERKDNQDFFFSDKEKHLYVVADGMGGYKGGALASKFASHLARDIFETVDSITSTSPDESIMSGRQFVGYEDALKHAFLDAHDRTITEGIDGAAQGMGCTIVLLLFRGNSLHIMNAGDCRCYQYCEETLRQVTRDHSKVEKLLRAKEISKEEAKIHPQRNLVEKWIGGNRFSGMPDTYSIPYYVNDRFILCSDGVTKVLNDAKIEEFAKMENIKDAVDGMILAIKDAPEEISPLTNKVRKKDNATVMMVEVTAKTAAWHKDEDTIKG